MAEVKVLGFWSSPFSARVEVALKLKGVEYEFVEEDPYLSNKSPLLLKSNPVNKQIPVLLHNGNPIAESLLILEYIDETFPGTPILPKDPYERALARFWAKFFDEKFSPAARKVRYTKGEEQEKAKEEVRELLKVLDNELKKKKFLGGETIGLADIAGNFVALWVGVLAEVLGVDLGITQQKFPNLCRWMEDYLNCNVIKETFPPRDKLIAHYSKRFNPAAASASG